MMWSSKVSYKYTKQMYIDRILIKIITEIFKMRSSVTRLLYSWIPIASRYCIFITILNICEFLKFKYELKPEWLDLAINYSQQLSIVINWVSLMSLITLISSSIPIFWHLKPQYQLVEWSICLTLWKENVYK